VRERLQRPQVRLLHEVLGLAGRTKGRAQLPDGGLGAADELGDRDVVAFASRGGEPREGIVVEHPDMMARREPTGDVGRPVSRDDRFGDV
jgi:hypothetical protein